MKRSISVLVVGLAGVGAVFVWSATHGANITSTLRDLLSGRAPVAVAEPGAQELGPTAQAANNAFQSASTAALRTNAQMQASGYGWNGSQWTALDQLWTRESDWNPTATNASSGAYGIAQFLDATWASVGGSKTSDPTLQIRYGLAYIKARYGDPVTAWAHEQSTGWY